MTYKKTLGYIHLKLVMPELQRAQGKRVHFRFSRLPQELSRLTHEEFNTVLIDTVGTQETSSCGMPCHLHFFLSSPK